MSTQLETSSGATPKFSRYRSVRRAAAEAQNQWTGEAPPAKPSNETITRSMSRYRRPKTANATPTNCPPVPSLPASVQAPQTASKSAVETVTPLSGAPPRTEKAQSPLSDHEDDDQLSEAEKARMREEAMRKLTMAEQPQARQGSRSQSVPAKDKGNPRKEVAGHSRRSSWKDRLGFSHHRKEDTTQPNNTNNTNMALSAPGIDAPVSAVNAGERRVMVKCKSNSIRLPVTPTTRVKDIVFSALNCFSERIDPRNAIIVESFSSLGLERPLRRYEHVRDVLNSWSSDDANALTISESPFDGASRKLELQAAPSTQPKDAKFYVYHSSKPGKWDKRYITLRADGQVVLSKKSEAKEAKDFTNICHMSDFDIYTPTSHQLAKSIKPPKKICFAIKSQQKSSVFLSTENFVRFFATSDSTVAQDFHDAVHGWRSWYLVHVLEVGKAQNETINTSVPTPRSRDGHSSPSTHHQHHISTDTIPYQLGSFKPLIDFGHNADPGVVASDQTVEETNATSWDMFLRKKKIRDHAPPPSSFPVNLPALETNKESLSPQDDDSTFSPDSLLGRTYSHRQAAQREREAREGNESDPFLTHGLLKNLSPTSTDQSSQNAPFSNHSSQQNSRSNTVRSNQRPAEGFSHSRSNSVRQKGKPLVDLTPTYREPPQHARKGHGVKIDSGMPLVEAATGLEAIPGVPNIPSATTWRRDEAAPAPIPGRRRANTAKSQHHNHAQVLDKYVTPSDAPPFIPNGLVALSAHNTPNAQYSTGVGRGVATGDRHATRPLLDMTPQSQFAEGSLLRSIEKS